MSTPTRSTCDQPNAVSTGQPSAIPVANPLANGMNRHPTAAPTSAVKVVTDERVEHNTTERPAPSSEKNEKIMTEVVINAVQPLLHVPIPILTPVETSPCVLPRPPAAPVPASAPAPAPTLTLSEPPVVVSVPAGTSNQKPAKPAGRPPEFTHRTLVGLQAKLHGPKVRLDDFISTVNDVCDDSEAQTGAAGKERTLMAATFQQRAKALLDNCPSKLTRQAYKEAVDRAITEHAKGEEAATIYRLAEMVAEKLKSNPPKKTVSKVGSAAGRRPSPELRTFIATLSKHRFPDLSDNELLPVVNAVCEDPASNAEAASKEPRLDVEAFNRRAERLLGSNWRNKSPQDLKTVWEAAVAKHVEPEKALILQLEHTVYEKLVAMSSVKVSSPNGSSAEKNAIGANTAAAAAITPTTAANPAPATTAAAPALAPMSPMSETEVIDLTMDDTAEQEEPEKKHCSRPQIEIQHTEHPIKQEQTASGAAVSERSASAGGTKDTQQTSAARQSTPESSKSLPSSAAAANMRRSKAGIAAVMGKKKDSSPAGEQAAAVPVKAAAAKELDFSGAEAGVDGKEVAQEPQIVGEGVEDDDDVEMQPAPEAEGGDGDGSSGQSRKRPRAEDSLEGLNKRLREIENMRIQIQEQKKQMLLDEISKKRQEMEWCENLRVCAKERQAGDVTIAIEGRDGAAIMEEWIKRVEGEIRDLEKELNAIP